MLLKQILLFLSTIIFCHFTLAQDFVITKELKQIDSLIKYYQLYIAQTKTDRLYKELNSNQQKKYRAQILELQFLKALILDKQEKSPAEVLHILLPIIEKTEAEELNSLSCHIFMLTALAYEKAENYALTKKYLDLAYRKIQQGNLEEVYSTYSIRRSSYYRYVNKLDSSYYFAKKAEKYARIYYNSKDLNDAYLLLGNYYSLKKDYKKALEYFIAQLDKTNIDISSQFNNVSRVHFKMKNYTQALAYSDSAYLYYKKLKLIDKYTLPELRYKIYDATDNADSAYHYFKQYHNNFYALQKEEEKLGTKKLEEQYQNDKKEITIQEKDNQMILIGSLLAVIAIASILLFGKNRQINHRNKIINQQLEELTQLLKQKQYLLSELQHRVKNNLQHVISILEIQKESADFNNIEELIRGNQNRIHSMALLHKKLNVSDNVNDVDFTRYITELSEIVKESYDNHPKKINLNINCDIETITIGKALPIGFILVELISNSMKHAFKKRNIGIIN